MENTLTQAHAEVAENIALIERQRTLDAMLVRSATDRAFRALLLTNPRAAFADQGVELPEGVEIRFIVNRHSATIVLPDAIDDMTEISEEELARLNGGAASVSAVASAVVESVKVVSAISTMACAGAVLSIGAVALTIYLATAE